MSAQVMKKKTKPGQKNKGPQTKTEEVESFFRWFTEVPEASPRLPSAGRCNPVAEGWRSCCWCWCCRA